MTAKKNPSVNKIEAPAEKIIPEEKKSQEYKAVRNFFFAGKTWAEGEVITLPKSDIEFLLSKQIIK